MSIQKISSIHSFILEIQQIIDFKGHTYIWTYPPIITKVTFSFPKYVLACKKSARFIHLFRDQSLVPIFKYNQPKIIKVILNFPFLTRLTDYWFYLC